MSKDVECEPMHAISDDGWSEYIHPLPGYLMQCCDCGLAHEMEFMIVPADDNDLTNPNEGEDREHVVIFRARRFDGSQEHEDRRADNQRRIALRRMVRIDEELGLYDDDQPIPTPSNKDQ